MNNTILRGVTSSALLTVYLFNIICMIFSFESTLFDYPGFSPIGIISVLLFIGIIVYYYLLGLLYCALFITIYSFFLYLSSLWHFPILLMTFSHPL